MSPRSFSVALALVLLASQASAQKHPDLQGYWTNATFVPLERPAELANKEFFTKEEAAEFDRKRLERENAQSKEDIHYDNALWQTETWGRVESRRTSIVFDPPNGRLPELSPEGKIQAAAKAEAARRRASADSAQDRSLAERCITWGNEGPPMLGSTYNANLQIVQTPNLLVIAHEIGHANRMIPLDGHPHLVALDPPTRRRLQRPLGRRHPGSRQHQFQRPNQFPRPPGTSQTRHLLRREPTCSGTLHPNLAQHHHLPLHRDRPHSLDQTLVRRVTNEPHQRPHLRIRLPRRQLRPSQHPSRRPRRRKIRRETHEPKLTIGSS